MMSFAFVLCLKRLLVVSGLGSQLHLTAPIGKKQCLGFVGKQATTITSAHHLPKENTTSKNHLQKNTPHATVHFKSCSTSHFLLEAFSTLLDFSPVNIGVPNLLAKFLSTPHMELGVKLSQPLTANRTHYVLPCDTIRCGVVLIRAALASLGCMHTLDSTGGTG